MKQLFLLLALLLAMEPVMAESCWTEGHCRLVCKEKEDSVIRCRNRKRCCVPDRYLTVEPVVIDNDLVIWTSPRPKRKRKKKKKNYG
ncbi:beta-defensin 119-like [Tenrec ecaudatus]|uniref:beta-defensin 119-like n=1 Tax=Tenrec ecaudatus TaxID=94439 RepID=UPI003F59498D